MHLGGVGWLERYPRWQTQESEAPNPFLPADKYDEQIFQKMGETTGSKSKNAKGGLTSTKAFFPLGNMKNNPSPEMKESFKMAATSDALQESTDPLTKRDVCDLLDQLDARMSSKIQSFMESVSTQCKDTASTINKTTKTAETAVELGLILQEEVK